MSDKKHTEILNELSAHPTARNIEWSKLLAALASIGELSEEANGKYIFVRNGHKMVFAQTQDKDVDPEEVMKLRRFLHLSSIPDGQNTTVPTELIVAITHHDAFISHNPGTETEENKRLRSELGDDSSVHEHPTAPPYSDSNPLEDKDYYSAVIKEMVDSSHIVILSHGKGSSNASAPLMELLHKKHPELIGRVVAIEKCDLESMTDPQLVHRGIVLLKAYR
jgi:hypothetical protein